MRIDHQIAELRSDAALQRCTQAPMSAAKKAWTHAPAVAPMLAELRHYGEGTELGALDALNRLMRDTAYAQHFIGLWSARICDALQQNALGQVPFRHSYSGGFSAMQIAQSGRATLSLIAYQEVDEVGGPISVNFADRDQVELVLAGHGVADIRERRGTAAVPVRSSRLGLEPGTVLKTGGPMLARQISKVKGRLAILQLMREQLRPQPSCEIRLSDGALIHQSCGHKSASQKEMALAVLGAMQRTDAVPVMTDMAEQEGPDHLRWEALRQALALDPKRGFAALSIIGADATDELSMPANALRQQLIETYPQLGNSATLEPNVPCPN